MTYPNLTDEEIRKLRDAIGNMLGNMESDIRKEKLKVFGLLLAIVAIAIVFLSPIVIATLGGAATLIAGNNSILSKAKDIKKNKEEVKNLDINQSNRKWATYMQSLMTKKPNKEKPSAPLYPDLN